MRRDYGVKRFRWIFLVLFIFEWAFCTLIIVFVRVDADDVGMSWRLFSTAFLAFLDCCKASSTSPDDCEALVMSVKYDRGAVG